jgi:hypothetical protein
MLGRLKAGLLKRINWLLKWLGGWNRLREIFRNGASGLENLRCEKKYSRGGGDPPPGMKIFFQWPKLFCKWYVE